MATSTPPNLARRILAMGGIAAAIGAGGWAFSAISASAQTPPTTPPSAPAPTAPGTQPSTPPSTGRHSANDPNCPNMGGDSRTSQTPANPSAL